MVACEGEILVPSIGTIRKTLSLICDSGSVYELRVIKHPIYGTIAGFYDDLDMMARHAYELTTGTASLPGRYKPEAVSSASSVFLTLNPVDPLKIVQEGMHNSYRVIPSKGKGGEASGSMLTADKDVVRRRRLPIDFDPWRDKKEISTTDLGHDHAMKRALDVRRYLKSMGFPEGMWASSGNGSHLVYGIDMANDEESTNLIKSFLQALIGKFGDNHRLPVGKVDESLIEVDSTVYNASRIFTVYGTWKRKGFDHKVGTTDNPSRPHRLARILSSPDKLDTVPVELLRRVIEECKPVDKVTVDMGVEVDVDVKPKPGSKSSEYEEFKAATAASPESADDPEWYKAYSGNLKTLDVEKLWASKGLKCVKIKEGTFNVQCPRCDRHSDDSMGGTTLFKEDGKWPCFNCERTDCRPEFGKGNKNRLRSVLSWFGPELVDACCTEHFSKASKASKGDEPKSDPGGTLIKLVQKNATLWMSELGNAYATIVVDGHKENLPLESSSFRDWLVALRWEQSGRTTKKDHISQAISVLSGIAKKDQREVHVRYARTDDDKLYIDVGDKDWNCIEVDRHGWRVIQDPPVMFCRTSNTDALPMPQAGGTTDMLKPFLAADDETWPLFEGFILAAMSGRKPFFHIVVNGEAGSIKSSASWALKRLIDPVKAGNLGEFPKTAMDVAIESKHEYALGYDNVSSLTTPQSDWLCKLATGGGIKTRALYTNTDQVIIDKPRPCILNGIPDFAEKTDLVDRCISIFLNRMTTGRLSEAKVREQFRRVHPFVFGALLDKLAKGLATWREVEFEKVPRMADACYWVTACTGSMRFVDAYTMNSEASLQNALESSPIASVLQKWLASFDLNAPNRKKNEWRGTAGELLEELKTYGLRCGMSLGRLFPETARGLGGMVRRDATALRMVGIEVSRAKSHGRDLICFSNVVVHTDEFVIEKETEVVHDEPIEVIIEKSIEVVPDEPIEEPAEKAIGVVIEEDIEPVDVNPPQATEVLTEVHVKVDLPKYRHTERDEEDMPTSSINPKPKSNPVRTRMSQAVNKEREDFLKMYETLRDGPFKDAAEEVLVNWDAA